jgi:uncharacterized membrane protein (DUF2068 family)
MKPSKRRTDGTENAAHRPARRERVKGLMVVGLLKLSKAVFFGAIAAGALHLVHGNVGDEAQRIVDKVNDALHIDSEGHFVRLLLDKADLINHHELRQAGLFSSLYAVVCVIEGTGLMLQKVWAEYFTIFLTVAALPYEVYELIDRFTNFKVGLLVLNLGVLFYLLWYLKRKREREMVEAGQG